MRRFVMEKECKGLCFINCVGPVQGIVSYNIRDMSLQISAASLLCAEEKFTILYILQFVQCDCLHQQSFH